MKNSKTQDIENIINITLRKYEGIRIEQAMTQIRSELNDVLNHYLSENYVTADTFPIKTENPLGKWEMHADGTTYFLAKKHVKEIEITINVLKPEE
jgi:hypothetical protein